MLTVLAASDCASTVLVPCFVLLENFIAFSCTAHRPFCLTLHYLRPILPSLVLLLYRLRFPVPIYRTKSNILHTAEQDRDASDLALHAQYREHSVDGCAICYQDQVPVPTILDFLSVFSRYRRDWYVCGGPKGVSALFFSHASVEARVGVNFELHGIDAGSRYSYVQKYSNKNDRSHILTPEIRYQSRLVLRLVSSDLAPGR